MLTLRPENPSLAGLVTLAGSLVAVQLSDSPLHAQGPPLNPDRAHVEVFLTDSAPAFRLTERRDGSGRNTIQVDERGLSINRAIVCSWPNGFYDGGNAVNMVLGYTGVSADGRPEHSTGCPPGVPIISKWGDSGLGGATLYIEVLSRTGSVVETQYGDRRFYLDLNRLPGDPRIPDPSFNLKPKGRVGWEWHDASREVAGRERAAVAALLEEPAFARFVTDVRGCLTSSRVPDCLVSFVSRTALDAHRGIRYATPEAFVHDIWQDPPSHGESSRLWDEVVGCLTAGHLRTRYGIRLEAEEGLICELRRELEGWKLAVLMRAP